MTDRLERILTHLLIFLVPTQLAFHFWPNYSHVFGIRIDYLSPTIFLTDILVFLLLSNWAFKDWRKFFLFLSKNRTLFFVLLTLAILNLIFSTSPAITAFRWIKVFEFLAFGLFIHFRKSFLSERIFLKTIYFSAIIFSLIGIAQFSIGKTIGGIFYFLGERSFSLSTPGIALTQIFGRDFLRSYSTFAHPNSLAGYLGVVLIVLREKWVFKKWKIIGIAIIATCFALTFSLSALIGIMVVAGLILSSKSGKLKTYVKGIFILSVLVSLLLPFFSKTFIERHIDSTSTVLERLDLSALAGKMISKKFLLGTGLNTFIVNIPGVRSETSYAWTLQPVHNIYLLIFAELGLLGVLFFLFSVNKVIDFSFMKRGKLIIFILIFILVTGVFDHYWLTLQQNILLVSLLLGFYL